MVRGVRYTTLFSEVRGAGWPLHVHVPGEDAVPKCVLEEAEHSGSALNQGLVFRRAALGTLIAFCPVGSFASSRGAALALQLGEPPAAPGVARIDAIMHPALEQAGSAKAAVVQSESTPGE